MLQWHRTVEYAELVDYYKGLIRLRKQLPGLCDKSASAAERIKEKEVHGEGVVSFLVDNRASADDAGWDELCVIYNVADQECTVKLNKGVWQILADGKTTDCRKAAAEAEKGVRVAARSGMLLGKKF